MLRSVPSDNVPFCLVSQPIWPTEHGTRTLANGTVIQWEDELSDETASQLEDRICTGHHLCGWDKRTLDCEH